MRKCYESSSIKFALPAGAFAVINVHPDGRDDKPSDADIKLANDYHLLMFSESTKGLWEYNYDNSSTTQLAVGPAELRQQTCRTPRSTLGSKYTSRRRVTLVHRIAGEPQPGMASVSGWRRRIRAGAQTGLYSLAPPIEGQCPSHRSEVNSATISDSVHIGGRLDRSSHFATSALLSIASARNQCS